MLTQDSVPHILRAAAVRVRQAWCQKQGLDAATNAVCAWGGIVVCANHDLRLSDHAVWYLARALGIALVRRPIDLDPVITVIFDWNDAPARTAEDVALALELAAVLAEQDTARPTASDRLGVDGGPVLVPETVGTK